MPRRTLLMGIPIIGLLAIFFAFGTQMSYPTLALNPAQTLTAFHQNIGNTAAAIKGNVAGTATAIKLNIEGTATAIKGNIEGTATAIKQNVEGTVTSIKGDISATLTAIAPTVNAYRTNIPGTATALAATVTAIHQDVGATLTAFASTVVAVKSTLALTKIPGDEATTVLTNYAVQTFGSDPGISKAGGANFNIVGTYPIPGQIIDAQSLTLNLATQVYIGQTANGILWLGYGTGTATNPTTNNTTNVQGAGLGIYTQSVPNSDSLNANSALALAKSVYPTLAGNSYASVSVKQGFGFYAVTYTYVLDPVTKQLVLTPESVFLGVIPGLNGTAYVTAAVGTGTYSAILHA